MPFCPYCKEIVGNGATECPSCGMTWSAGEQAQSAPRIVSEEPRQQPTYQQPPPQYQQPPPQQPAYQQPPQYQQQYQPPPQPAYQPQPQYRQPPPQYQAPPPQYQQPYAAPRPRRMVGIGSMIGAIIGGVIALIATFMLFFEVYLNDSNLVSMMDFLDGAPNEFMYAYLIPVFGIIAILTASIGYAIQNKGLGYVTGILGIFVLIIPLVFAFHLASESGEDIQDIFYFSSENAFDQGYWQMYLGGFMSMSAGLMIAISGFGLAGKIRRVRQPPQQYYR
ncbi:MAG: hypothetical protein PHU53_06895 [Thermoplasmata archaeon]|nr:hypothetical protein [Thermoplasmata archaeon]